MKPFKGNKESKFKNHFEKFSENKQVIYIAKVTKRLQDRLGSSVILD